MARILSAKYFAQTRRLHRQTNLQAKKYRLPQRVAAWAAQVVEGAAAVAVSAREESGAVVLQGVVAQRAAVSGAAAREVSVEERARLFFAAAREVEAIVFLRVQKSGVALKFWVSIKKTIRAVLQ